MKNQLKYGIFTLFCLFMFGLYANSAVFAAESTLPEGFVYISDEVPDVILEMRYFSTYNFVGALVDGYKLPVAIMTKEGAAALKKVAKSLYDQGYIIKIFDAYRPQNAVDHFKRWAKDIKDTKMKYAFYPKVDKSRLFELEYIIAKSGHSRGSTIDLTIVDMRTGKEVDMGGPFDFFGEISHPGTKLISKEQAANREILMKAMKDEGFIVSRNEWWHYRLTDEPYPGTYFTFPVQ